MLDDTTTIHVRSEILRTVRNRRILIFTLGLPLVLFFRGRVGEPPRHVSDGISFPLYFMAAMAAYGAHVRGRSHPGHASRWTGPRAGPANCGSRRCGPRTYFLAKVAHRLRGRAAHCWPWSTWPGRRSGCISSAPSGWR